MSSVTSINGMTGYAVQIAKMKSTTVKGKESVPEEFRSETITTRTDATKNIELSEAEKLEAFKKEIWKELDSLPWNKNIDTSIRITDSAFKRMMNDDDFKNRMMDVMKRASIAGRPPITACLTWIDENGYKGYSYLDADAGKLTYREHSKESFYKKESKKTTAENALKEMVQKRKKQHDIQEKEYWDQQYLQNYFNSRFFGGQQTVQSGMTANATTYSSVIDSYEASFLTMDMWWKAPSSMD